MDMRKEDKNNLVSNDFNRTDRIFQDENGWYFTIRQGAAFGPYETKQHAEKHLTSFVSLIQ